ncbi:MAG: trehalase family glycosidase [Kiritimatiellia bacterium]|jgi:putative isomerase|nr:trehalase family glycosidase [Kiritimatiellia bacterium]
MKRRDFMKLAGGTTLAQLFGEIADASESGEIDIRAMFESNREDALKLTEDVIQKCVLDKIVPPEPPLRQMWVRPGGPYYKGQWIWDTMFVLDLLSILPGKKKLIRDIFQNYWDFQDRWNAEQPDYARDMITVAIKTEPQEVRQFSQIPILAWGVERVYRRNGDKDLLKQCLGRLERFHEWFWRERDVTNVGLVAVGSYSGKIQHARWETFDYECNMDGLKLTPHPTRKGKNEGAWYGDICVTGNTSYLVLAERSLVRLAKIMGDSEMAARRRPRIEKAVEAMRTHMWDEKAGTFLSVKRDTMEKIPVATISSWMPLTAGVPTKAMARRMAGVLSSPAWQTPLPVPTVDSTDKRWKSKSFWRGDVWPPTNYQISSGLADYGHRDLAADIADKTVANAIKNGISEHYDSVSGKPLGVKDYCMSSTLVMMMLDGLTQEYTLKCRDSKQFDRP